MAAHRSALHTTATQAILPQPIFWRAVGLAAASVNCVRAARSHGHEDEQEYRRERQAAGIAVAKRRGVYRGRTKGTTKAKPALALALRARGFDAAEIGNALKVSPCTVFQYLAEGTTSVRVP